MFLLTVIITITLILIFKNKLSKKYDIQNTYTKHVDWVTCLDGNNDKTIRK